MLVIDPESFRQQQSPRGIEDADPYNEKSLPPVGEGFFYFHILIIPNALATELARMTAAKIGQSQRIMKRNTFLRRKG